MIPAWYERMNRRERILSWIVAGALIVLLNLVIWSWLFGALGRARTQLATRQAACAISGPNATNGSLNTNPR